MVRKLGFLLLALATLGAAGAWNYRRNLALEEKQRGPYASYSDAQLTVLAEAYAAEIEKHGAHYAAEKGKRHVAQDGRYMDERVADFERAATRGRAIRDAGGDLAEREAALRDIEAEQAKRGQDPTQLFLRRLLGF